MTHDPIAHLNLAPIAEHGARLLSLKFPQILFTSGRRNLDTQARAMASHVYQNSSWVINTYKHGALLQPAIDQYRADGNPWEVGGLAILLFETISRWPPERQLLISKHLTGHAFDCHWDETFSQEAADFCLSLEGIDKVITNEDGFKVLHVQFKEHAGSELV